MSSEFPGFTAIVGNLQYLIKMNIVLVKTLASAITSTLLISMVGTWYLIQEFLGESMAIRLLIPAYAWSLMTLWGEEIKDLMRGERKSEHEPEEEAVEYDHSWEFITEHL